MNGKCEPVTRRAIATRAQNQIFHLSAIESEATVILCEIRARVARTEQHAAIVTLTRVSGPSTPTPTGRRVREDLMCYAVFCIESRVRVRPRQVFLLSFHFFYFFFFLKEIRYA